MKRLVFTLCLVASIAQAQFVAGAQPTPQVSPYPPAGQSSQQASYNSVVPAVKFVPPVDAGCATPGSSLCTTILAATNVSAWRDVSVYIQVLGADAGVDAGANNATNNAALATVLVEVSNDGYLWTDLCQGTCAPIAVGAQTVLNYHGPYTWLRVEGQSAGTWTAIQLSAEH